MCQMLKNLDTSRSMLWSLNHFRSQHHQLPKHWIHLQYPKIYFKCDGRFHKHPHSCNPIFPMITPHNSSLRQGVTVQHYGELVHGFCFTQYINLTDPEDAKWLSFKSNSRLLWQQRCRFCNRRNKLQKENYILVYWLRTMRSTRCPLIAYDNYTPFFSKHFGNLNLTEVVTR
jgi:hypothetical protein